MIYSIAHAKQDLEQLIDQALAGELVVIVITEGVGVHLVPIDSVSLDHMQPDV